MKTTKKLMIHLVVAVLLPSLVGCDEHSSVLESYQPAVEIESRDECHLCGMIITSLPGPKGEVYSRHESQVLKFCSTRDMFAYILEPENSHNIQSVYVHDMAKSPWHKPKDEFLINARNAWYVSGHDLAGAMGSTLASFSKKMDAEAFSAKHGGKVITFTDVDHESL